MQTNKKFVQISYRLTYLTWLINRLFSWNSSPTWPQ